MLKASKDGINIVCYPSKTIKDSIAVSVGFDLDVNADFLHKLSGKCAVPTKNDHISILAYCLYLGANTILCGDALSAMKSRVTSVEYAVNNGSFSINWRIVGTVSAVRVSLGLVLKVLDPSKYFATYSTHCRSVGLKPTKEGFSWCVNKIAPALEKPNIFLVGRIKIDQDSLNNLCEVIAKKHNVSKAPAGSAPTDNNADEGLDSSKDYVVAAEGLGLVLLHDLLSVKVKKLAPRIVGNGLSVGIPEAVWNTLKGKLPVYIPDYIKKYDKFDDVGAVLCYVHIAAGHLTPKGAAKVAGATKENMTAELKKVL